MLGAERPRETESQVSPPFYLAICWEEWEKKDQFRRVLALCLLAPTQCPRLLVFLYLMIRDRMVAIRQWTAQVDQMVQHQFRHEFGAEIDPLRVRRACPELQTGEHIGSRTRCPCAACVSLSSDGRGARLAFAHCVSPWRRVSGFSEQTDSALPHEV